MTSSNWRFHHVGLATESVSSFLKRFNDVEVSEILDFEDSLQGVHGKFVSVGDVVIEVMEPLNNDKTLEPWLLSGNRLYQIAFEVDDLDLELKGAREKRIRVVRDPHPATAFGGRRVAFLMPAPGLLIELIESC